MTQPINLPPISEHSSGREHIRMHRELLDHANGVIQRKVAELAASYDPATDTGGIFLDPVGGNDLWPGAADRPVKSMQEINRRLEGVSFSNAKNPTIRLLDDASPSGDDGIVASYDAFLIDIVGRDIALEPGLLLAAATDLDPSVDFGYVQVTGFDFTDFVGNADHTVWVRRQDDVTSALYAPLMRLGSTVDKVFIGKQVQRNNILSLTQPTPSPLVAGQSIDLVRFPHFPWIRSDANAFMRLSRVDHNANFPHRGNLGWYVVGHSAPAALFERTSVQGVGAYLKQGISAPFSAAGLSIQACSVGSAAGQTQVSIQCAAQLTAVSAEKASIFMSSSGSLRLVSGYTHGASTALIASETSAIDIIAAYGGSDNTKAAVANFGGRIFGAGNAVNNLGAPTNTWEVDGVAGPQPAAPVLGNNGSAMYP